MDIKNNTANIVSISRVFVAFIAIGLLFVDSRTAYLISLLLTAVAFIMDGVDGYIARKYNQSSEHIRHGKSQFHHKSTVARYCPYNFRRYQP